MTQPIQSPLFAVDAILWVGNQRISGVFSVEKDAITFQLEPDPPSHFSLYIPKNEIRRIEEFLVFGISRNGLCIKSRDGKEDRFVVEDPASLKQVLLGWRRS